MCTRYTMNTTVGSGGSAADRGATKPWEGPGVLRKQQGSSRRAMLEGGAPAGAGSGPGSSEFEAARRVGNRNLPADRPVRKLAPADFARGPEPTSHSHA